MKVDITPEELFQCIKDESGFGEAMKLEQLDADVNEWVAVTAAEDIEPADGAKFRVVCACDTAW